VGEKKRRKREDFESRSAGLKRRKFRVIEPGEGKMKKKGGRQAGCRAARRGGKGVRGRQRSVFIPKKKKKKGKG